MIEKSSEFDSGSRRGAKGAMSKSASGSARTFQSTEIFADAQEIIIEHEGDKYRLRRTSKGKLILTK